jgi:glycine/D-amino acid oxidase-like deaminating enzyme
VTGRAVGVAVVGAGVVEPAAVYALLDRGLTVAVLGPRPAVAPGQASAAAGAMLSLFSEVDASQPKRWSSWRSASSSRASFQAPVRRRTGRFPVLPSRDDLRSEVGDLR